MSIEHLLIYLFIGLLGGFLSGLVGVGGGVVIVPMLVLILGFSQQSAQGTTLAMMLPPIGVLAVINYAKVGYVDFKAAALMVATFLIGSYFSSKYAVKISGDMLRKIFALFLLISAIQLFFKK